MLLQQKRSDFHNVRGTIRNIIPSSSKPKCLNLRDRIGDLEVDLLKGSNYKSELLVMTERTTLNTECDKLESIKFPDGTTAMIVKLIHKNLCGL